MLLATDEDVVYEANDAGLDGFVVDCEDTRQFGSSVAEEKLARDTREHLRRVRSGTPKTLILVTQDIGEATRNDIDVAVSCGVSEILMPRIRAAREVEGLLRCVDGRCGVGIVIETVEAIERGSDLATLPVARVYVDLDDLAVARGFTPAFRAVYDGTLDRLRRLFTVPFGFGSLTLPDRGYPVPGRLVMGEMARIGCDYAFLRGSFLRDSRGMSARTAVSAVRAGLEGAFGRTAAEVRRDQMDFRTACSLGGLLPHA